MQSKFNLFKIFIHLCVIRPFVKIFFGVNIKGRENILNLDRYIIIANHNSHLDTLLLFHALPVKHILITHPVAAKEYFSKSKILFRIVDVLFQPLWITRGVADKHYNPLKVIKDKLDEGHNIILFPEGTRGTPGKFKPFQSSIGRLSEEYPDIPVVPILLSGPERALPKHSSIPLPIWNNVVIGPPQIIKESHIKITRALEHMLLELSETENKTRHRRKVKNVKPVVSIAILGIDGSGKSTISKR
jgi:1-acyl-sn-glycerol-3-phosphate acyltransferase